MQKNFPPEVPAPDRRKTPQSHSRFTKQAEKGKREIRKRPPKTSTVKQIYAAEETAGRIGSQ